MSLSIRILRFPMLFLANSMGIMGVATGYTLLILHVFTAIKHPLLTAIFL
jgi:spore germination protein KA